MLLLAFTINGSVIAYLIILAAILFGGAHVIAAILKPVSPEDKVDQQVTFGYSVIAIALAIALVTKWFFLGGLF